ncbi:hypothetical protein CAEBREN_32743 [Caenorhabditis brenneri]|uniref:BTB domain-containing protein n=1 Tax=Caenorhabditis brenneri TaxID=135651 RepID=G0MFX8_CAEBE|nr:hypothetical protein CAEBREN_32743 [Caenorhabditis brenneri]
MTDQPITHKSEKKLVPGTNGVLETTEKNGIKCVWSRNFIYHPDVHLFELRFSWSFDWNELKKSGVSGLSGHITVTSNYIPSFSRKIDIDLTENPQVIETTINPVNFDYNYTIAFEYHLLPYRLQIREEISYDDMFLPSELNDTILVIDDKRLHVNRVFLSYHSEFFRTLFSSKFKEGQMDEIPIKDVSYEDFGLLMSTIYPETVYPNDKTVEKLLELADRFLIPSVIRHVEFHLLRDSRINSEKLIWMADEYGMPKLLEKCMDELNTVEKVKKLHDSPEYKKLSQGTKVQIFDILMKMI